MRANDDGPTLFSTSGHHVSMNDFEGRLILVRPIEEVNVASREDPSRSFPATRVHVIEITEAAGGYVDHGDDIPCFWSFVRRQLREDTSPEAPWLLGRVSRGDRAFILRGAPPADCDAAHRAISRWEADGGTTRKPFDREPF